MIERLNGQSGEAGRRMTDPSARFFSEHAELLIFGARVLKGALWTKQVEPTLTASLGKNIPMQNWEEFVSEWLLLEMTLTRTVENFLCYLKELIALIYQSKPEMLRAHSKESETLDFILKHSDMGALISAIAEKRVEQLSYRGFKDLLDYLEKQMGFTVLDSTDAVEKMTLLIEVRNLCVHNRGHVSDAAVGRVPALERYVGKRYPMDYRQVTQDREFVARCVSQIDAEAITKFSLPLALLPVAMRGLDDPGANDTEVAC
jgi:hypothetical protein